MVHKAYALLALATLFWAGNSIAGKLAVGHVSPMVIVSVRWLILMVVLYACNSRQVAADWPVLRPRLGYLLLLGTLGFTGFSALLFYALIYTSAINSAILQGGMPLFVFCASFILFGSRVSLKQVIGFMISFVGVIAIAVRGDLSNLMGLGINFGDALMLIGIISYGIYTAALRSKPQVHWASLMVVLCLGATLSSLPFLFLEVIQGTVIFPDLEGWAVIAYIVIFPSLLGQVFHIRSVELIGANRAGLFANLLPIWGALLAVVLLGEAFHLYHAVALVMILAGIGLAEYSRRSKS
ncbi:DMT family transporter [Pusillimonas sp.]|uniref:DMT family transporter n=1 Tax=Pusillimonas sp. TaxID=3040095 RepID=UPI0037C7A8BB